MFEITFITYSCYDSSWSKGITEEPKDYREITSKNAHFKFFAYQFPVQRCFTVEKKMTRNICKDMH